MLFKSKKVDIGTKIADLGKAKDDALKVFTTTLDKLRTASESFGAVVDEAEAEIAKFVAHKETAQNHKAVTDGLIAKIEDFVGGK